MKSLGFLTTCSILALSATQISASAQEESVRPLEEIIVSATKRDQTLQEVPIAVSAYSSELLKNSGVTDLRELAQLSPSLFLSSSASEAAGAVARIRGIGTTGDNAGLESAVAIFIDGVYRNRTNVGLSELGELERVEVLRGPQGTLFGRNASAGLINVTTKKPSFETTGYGEVSYGNYDYIRVAGGLSGPLVEDKVAARIDGVFTRRDGFLKDKVTGEDYNNRDRYLIRGQLLVEPSDDISFRLIADYSDRDEDCCAAVTVVRGPTANIIEALGGELGSGGSDADPNPYSRRSATTPGRGFQSDVEEYGVSGELNWDLPFGQLTSITAYRDWELFRSQDIDFTSLDILYRDEDGFRNQFQTFSQEVRLNGQAGFLDWLVGFYFADEDLEFDDAVRVGADYGRFADNLVRTNPAAAAFPGFQFFRPFVQGAVLQGLVAQGVPLAIAQAQAAGIASLAPQSILFPEGSGVAQDSFRQNSRNFALFTHNIISLSDAVDLTLGARYTDERKKLDASIESDNPACNAILSFLGNPNLPAAVAGQFAGFAALPCAPFISPTVDGVFDSRRGEEEVTGTAAINIRWNEDFSSYASYSRGYKAGGFNLDHAALTAFNPNATTDLQFEEETVNSYELGAKLRTEDRTANLNATVFYSKFKDFQLNSFNGISFVVENLPQVETYGFELDGAWQATENLSFTGGLTYANTQYGNDTEGLPILAQPSAQNPAGGALFQLPGRQITNAPRWSLSGASTYEQPLSEDLLGFLHLDFRFTSRINTGSDLDLEKEQEGVFIANGRIGVGDIDRHWRIEVFARNIFDKNYTQVVIDQPLQGSGTARNTLIPNTQTFGAFLAEPRTFGVTLRGEF